MNKTVKGPRARRSSEAMGFLARARPASLDHGPADLAAEHISARYASIASAGRDGNRGRVRVPWTLRLAVAGAGLAVTAGAVAVGASGTAGPVLTQPPAGMQAQDAAFVLDRAAAAQVNSYRMISVVRSRGSAGVTYTDLATQQDRFVSGLRASSGGPYLQISRDLAGHRWKETDVEYQHHVWSTQNISSFDHGSYATISAVLPLQTNANPALAFRQALKAGIITVAGHRSLNGRDTILIRVKANLKFGRPDAPAAKNPPPETLVWLDASTYLVVQIENFRPILHWPAGSLRPGRPAPWGKETLTWAPNFDYVTWLPPTRGNLALLTVTPPAGFTKISAREMDQKYLGPIS